VLVQPDTVLRWHREWLRRRWTRRSAGNRCGRPTTEATIRTLVRKMAGANPLWGAPTDPWRTGQLGRGDIGADRLPASGTASAVLTDGAHICHEPSGRIGLNRFLHCTAVPGAIATRSPLRWRSKLASMGASMTCGPRRVRALRGMHSGSASADAQSPTYSIALRHHAQRVIRRVRALRSG
jgi:hypothetical protein